jgi:hypothetical protein
LPQLQGFLFLTHFGSCITARSKIQRGGAVVVQAVQQVLLMLLYFTKSGIFLCVLLNLALSSPLGSMPSLCPPVHMKIECVEKEAVY